MEMFLVEAKSRQNIREIANTFRMQMGQSGKLWFPIVEVLELMSNFFPSFNYEIVADDELPKGIHADTEIRTGKVRIKESVYNQACEGEGRDRMTIAHEIGHFIMLCFYRFKIECVSCKVPVPTYRDPEWQAKCFAGELMVPYELTKGMSPDEIAEKCGVSLDAAKIQHKYAS